MPVGPNHAPLIVTEKRRQSSAISRQTAFCFFGTARPRFFLACRPRAGYDPGILPAPAGSPSEDRVLHRRRARPAPCFWAVAALCWACAAARADGPPKHWAFRPVQAPPVPAVKDAVWVRNPIDAFILAKLEAENLKPAPSADKSTLLRRVYFDLIGLPPTPDEQKAFLDDASPRAFEKVVDGLLARPEYGERWARHWLDVVRYADSNGYERDGAKPSAWRYRDYVIDAFNKDKPYDRFVTEQLAGDEVPGADAETQTALTFLRLGTWDDEPADPAVDRCDQLDDVLGTTASAFLGVTLRCARCHDHKFDPFTQKDYYGMLAVFDPLKRPQNGRTELDLPVGTAEEGGRSSSAGTLASGVGRAGKSHRRAPRTPTMRRTAGCATS